MLGPGDMPVVSNFEVDIPQAGASIKRSKKGRRPKNFKSSQANVVPDSDSDNDVTEMPASKPDTRARPTTITAKSQAHPSTSNAVASSSRAVSNPTPLTGGFTMDIPTTRTVDPTPKKSHNPSNPFGANMTKTKTRPTNGSVLKGMSFGRGATTRSHSTSGLGSNTAAEPSALPQELPAYLDNKTSPHFTQPSARGGSGKGKAAERYRENPDDPIVLSGSDDGGQRSNPFSIPPNNTNSKLEHYEQISNQHKARASQAQSMRGRGRGRCNKGPAQKQPEQNLLASMEPVAKNAGVFSFPISHVFHGKVPYSSLDTSSVCELVFTPSSRSNRITITGLNPRLFPSSTVQYTTDEIEQWHCPTSEAQINWPNNGGPMFVIIVLRAHRNPSPFPDELFQADHSGEPFRAIRIYMDDDKVDRTAFHRAEQVMGSTITNAHQYKSLKKVSEEVFELPPFDKVCNAPPPSLKAQQIADATRRRSLRTETGKGIEGDVGALLRQSDRNATTIKAKNIEVPLNANSARPSTSTPSSVAVPAARKTRAANKKQQQPTGPVDISDDSEVEEVSTKPSRIRRPSEPAKDTVVLTYPWLGTGGVTITYGDLDRLNEGEFLNDTLLEFGLKRILARFQETNPELADSIYLFSSFFFKKLTHKPGDKKKEFDAYATVAKWTSKVDLFKKRFVVVPINEHMHWYMAIITDPGLVLRPPDPSRIAPKKNSRKSKRISQAADKDEDKALPAPTKPMDLDPDSTGEQDMQGLSLSTLPKRSRSNSHVSSTSGSSIRDRTNVDEVRRRKSKERRNHLARSASDPEQEQDDSKFRIPTDKFMAIMGEPKEEPSPPPPVTATRHSDAEEPPKPGRGLPETPQKRCSVLTFDSLGTTHKPVGRALKRYLEREAYNKGAAKEGVDELSVNEVQDGWANVVQQDNYCDCGVFVLQLFEKFIAGDPKSHQEVASKIPAPPPFDPGPDWTIWHTFDSGLPRNKANRIFTDQKDLDRRRQDLRKDILQLSEEWNKWKEEQAKLDAERKAEKKRLKEAKAATEATSTEPSRTATPEPSKPATPEAAGNDNALPTYDQVPFLDPPSRVLPIAPPSQVPSTTHSGQSPTQFPPRTASNQTEHPSMMEPVYSALQTFRYFDTPFVAAISSEEETEEDPAAGQIEQHLYSPAHIDADKMKPMPHEASTVIGPSSRFQRTRSPAHERAMERTEMMKKTGLLSASIDNSDSSSNSGDSIVDCRPAAQAISSVPPSAFKRAAPSPVSSAHSPKRLKQMTPSQSSMSRTQGHVVTYP